jgi:hypothetical protein
MAIMTYKCFLERKSKITIALFFWGTISSALLIVNKVET